MTKYILSAILISSIILGSVLDTKAQECNEITKAIKISERLQEEGDLENAYAKLFLVLEKKPLYACKSERLKAEVLLTEISLFMNRDNLADNHYRNALEIYPVHRIDTALKSIDLYYFVKNYKPIPVLSIRPYVAANDLFSKEIDFPNSNIYNIVNNDFDSTTNSNKEYDDVIQFTTSFNFGLQVNWHLFSFLEMSVGAAYGQKYLEIGRDIGYDYLEVVEKQNWITIPVLAKINFATQDHIPKLLLGVKYGRLSKSVLIAEDNINIQSSEKSLNINHLRNKNHYAYSIGLGYDFRPTKLMRHYISLEFRYDSLQTVLVNSANRYNTPATVFGLSYVDYDIPKGIGSFEISAGISLTQYMIAHKIKE